MNWRASVSMALVAALAALWPQGSRAADARDRIGMQPDPAWVVIADASDNEKPTQAIDGVRYLLVSDQVNVSGIKPVWHRRLVYEVQHQRGLASAGQFSIDFQPDYQQVRLHAIDIWRDGMRQDRRAASRIETLRREADLERGLTDGRLTFSITIPDLRVGDRVDYRYSVEGSNPVFGNGHYDVYSASYSSPLARRHVRATYPDGMPMKWQVTRKGYAVVEERLGPDRVVDMSISALPRQKQEDATPDSHDAFGRIRFSTTPDWAAVARWASPLYPSRFRDRDVAKRMAAKLQLDPADKNGSLLRAIAFAQGEVRYTGLDMGQNSHAPNPPELVLQRRFGDCKDKAVLLVSLLAEAGIAAEPVLVNTVDGRLDRQLPSPLAFDHVVVRALHDGRHVWIDPTRDRERGPIEDRRPLPFGAGLPIHNREGVLASIPDAMPEGFLVDVHQRIALTISGDQASADFGVVTRYAQDHATGVRDNFANNGEEDVAEQYGKYMLGFYDGIRSASLPSLSDSDETGRSQTTESYSLDWNMEEEGSTFGVLLFQLADWMPDLEDTTRRSPLGLSGARSARQTIRVSLSQGWSILPEVEKVENEYFSFVRTVRVDGDDLLVQGEWRRTANEVPAADYALVQRDYASARELLHFDIELSRGMEMLSAGAPAWRWPLLALLVLIGALMVGWRHRTRNAFAGMLFRPRATMASIGTGGWVGVWVLVGLSGLVSAMVGPVAEYLHAGGPEHLASAFIEVLRYGFQLLVWVALLRLALLLLATRVALKPLFAASAWGQSPPFLLLAGCSIIAIGGNPALLAEGYPISPAEMPGLMVAGVLLAAAICWMVVGSINAFSVVAGTSRRRIAAAFGMMLPVVLLIVAVYTLFVHFN
ncbi:MAG: DUF3857 domain-containing protein [Pseudomonadota bacterium]|nr:DUF3857 domain-containing protein [Pseudomonadota bacterium]